MSIKFFSWAVPPGEKNVAKFENANAFLSENNRFDVLRRPFLLQNIEDFLPENSIKTPINTHRFTFEYEIYQQLIQKWIEREAEIVVEKMDKTANSQRKKLYCENLNALSQSLATTFFEHNELDISIDTILYESWVNEFLKDREKPLARTHSLLSRYEDNLFHFAHRSIFDFFLAEAVFNCRILEKDFRNRKNEYTDAFDFYNQMCWHRLARLDFEVKQELDDNGDCQKFIDEQYGQGGADAYEKYIQPNDTMSVRAFLLGNMPDLNKLKGNLTSDDTLFVILGEVIYQKIKSLASIMEQLLACAEKLTNSSTKTLTTQEVIDCGKSLTLSKAIKLFLHDITGKGDYVFIHPLFFQFFQIGRFAGVAVKISKHNFKTIVAPKRHFIPPLSIFFDFENEWLEERVFFNQIKIWNNEKAQKDLLVEKAYHDLRMQSELFLQNNELELAELRQFLTRFPKTYHLLDVRNNLLRGYLSENEMPENARFKIRLEGNPLTDAQKATCLDTLRPYLHTETVIDFEKTLGRGLYPCMVTIEGGTFIMGDDELLTPATTKPQPNPPTSTPKTGTMAIKDFGTYHALLIAIEDYADPGVNKLDNPVKDALQLQKTLTTAYHFDPLNVKLLKNPS